MAILMVGPLILDLYEHAANGGERFGPARTGFDHFAFRAESYSDLGQWAGWLDAKRVAESEIRGTAGVGWRFDFVDPDGRQIEFLSLNQAMLAAMDGAVEVEA
jgi:hypothetical protein